MDTARFRTSGPAGGLTVAAIQKIRITKDLVYVHVTNHLSVTSSRLFEQENPDNFFCGVPSITNVGVLRMQTTVSDRAVSISH